eukprot:SAG31_NODE_3194_length_4570_cov_4.557593_3_plen_133_part_00
MPTRISSALLCEHQLAVLHTCRSQSTMYKLTLCNPVPITSIVAVVPPRRPPSARQPAPPLGGEINALRSELHLAKFGVAPLPETCTYGKVCDAKSQHSFMVAICTNLACCVHDAERIYSTTRCEWLCYVAVV